MALCWVCAVTSSNEPGWILDSINMVPIIQAEPQISPVEIILLRDQMLPVSIIILGITKWNTWFRE
jgi:hypothetical protein